MPTVAIVKDRILNINYGWSFIIHNAGELMHWWDSVRMSRSKKEFSDALRCIRNADGQPGHAKEGAALLAISNITGEGIAQTLGRLNESAYAGMLKCLEQESNKSIAINKYGGYMSLSERYELLYEHEVNSFILPGNKIHILQWDQGTHYYAKIGEIDVEWQGQYKWKTKKEAKEAAIKYLAELKI